jgi:hypothetical protein
MHPPNAVALCHSARNQTEVRGRKRFKFVNRQLRATMQRYPIEFVRAS